MLFGVSSAIAIHPGSPNAPSRDNNVAFEPAALWGLMLGLEAHSTAATASVSGHPSLISSSRCDPGFSVG